MKNDRDLVIVSIFTFITVVMWVFFEFTKTSRTSTVSSTTQQLITPLDPKIDTDVLMVLENRQGY